MFIGDDGMQSRKRLEQGFALGDYLLMTILVMVTIVVALAVFGVTLDDVWNMSVGQLDRSVSGVTGGSNTYNASYHPNPPSPTSPTTGTVSPGINTFTWQGNDASEGVDRYRVTVQRYVNLRVISFWIPAGTKHVRCNLGVGCTSARVPLPLAGQYRWKVQAHNGKGWGNSTGYNYITAK
jgi:hypothetical protein